MASCTRYTIMWYSLLLDGGFFLVLRFHPRYHWHIVESGVKHKYQTRSVQIDIEKQHLYAIIYHRNDHRYCLPSCTNRSKDISFLISIICLLFVDKAIYLPSIIYNFLLTTFNVRIFISLSTELQIEIGQYILTVKYIIIIVH